MSKLTNKVNKYLTLEQKVKIVNLKITKKISNVTLAKQFGVTVGTIYRILKNANNYINTLQNVTNLSKYSQLRSKSIMFVEVVLHKWFIHYRGLNLVITDEILQVKGLDIFNKLKETPIVNELPESFLFSNGWLENFKNKYEISSKRVCGEGGSVDKKTIEEERVKLRELLKDYNKEDILNADETGLFYCLRPNYTLANGKEDAATGVTQSKLRVTVLLCCNVSGNFKYDALIIGKYKNPRSFLTKAEMKNLNIMYDNSTNSWITSIIWIQWITQLDKCLTRKTLLLVDNCSAHKTINYDELKLKNLNIKFLPPNTTSHLQPCDAGIIQNFKVNYRKQLLKLIINSYETTQKEQTIPFSEVMKFISKAWNMVTPTTINNCWYHTKIVNNLQKIEDKSKLNDTNELEKNLKQLKLINPKYDMTANDFINIDKNINHLQNQESYVDVLINELKQKFEARPVTNELLHQMTNNLNNKQDFHKIITNAQQQNNDLLIDVFYNICKSMTEQSNTKK